MRIVANGGGCVGGVIVDNILQYKKGVLSLLIYIFSFTIEITLVYEFKKIKLLFIIYYLLFFVGY